MIKRPKKEAHDELLELFNLDVDAVHLVDLGAVPKSKWVVRKGDDVYQIEKADGVKVLPYQNLSVDTKSSWDAGAARKALRSWATLGGEVNISKYRRGFMIQDGDADNLTSYKYPIATVKGGRLVVVFSALSAAIGRGQKSLPDDIFKRMVNTHIKRYYKKVDKELPETVKMRIAKESVEALISFSDRIGDDDLRAEFLELVGGFEKEEPTGTNGGDKKESAIKDDPVIAEINTRLEQIEVALALQSRGGSGQQGSTGEGGESGGGDDKTGDGGGDGGGADDGTNLKEEIEQVVLQNEESLQSFEAIPEEDRTDEQNEAIVDLTAQQQQLIAALEELDGAAD